MKTFEEAYSVDISGYVEEKNKAKYLSWAPAWREFCKIYPEAFYEIKKNPERDNLPLFGDGNIGYMVYTSITVGDLTHDMWLPVMDGANMPMKDSSYTYKGWKWENGKKIAVDKMVASIDMFEINKTVMRCLVKNMAMFGLGLILYTGEDLPKQLEDIPEPSQNKQEPAPKGKAEHGQGQGTLNEFSVVWGLLTEEQKEYFGRKYPSQYGPQKNPQYFKKAEKEAIIAELKEKGIVK